MYDNLQRSREHKRATSKGGSTKSEKPPMNRTALTPNIPPQTLAPSPRDPLSGDRSLTLVIRARAYGRRAAPWRSAFTLVELLVVVTIIVVLLAMLSPALSRAIYAAHITQCGAQQKTTANGVIQYAFDFKKYYPDSQLPRQEDANRTVPVNLVAGASNPGSRFHAIDLRPELKGYVQVNKQLMDPLSQPVNLEDPTLDGQTQVGCSYPMWFGWHYESTKYAVNQKVNNTSVQVANGESRYDGMERLGDQWAFGGRNRNLLMGDLDLVWNGKANISASHPDIGPRPRLWNHVAQNVFEPTYGANALQSHWVYFSGGVATREKLDMNYAYDDASVHRLAGLEFEDDRYDTVSHYYDMSLWNSFRTHIPKR